MDVQRTLSNGLLVTFTVQRECVSHCYYLDLGENENMACLIQVCLRVPQERSLIDFG